MVKLPYNRKAQILEKLAKIPGWAKAFARESGGVVNITKWPKSKLIMAKLKMLQSGRLNRSVLKKGKHIYSGDPAKPKGGWPKGSAMDLWRAQAGRK